MSRISAVEEILASISRLPAPTQSTAASSNPSQPASRDISSHTSPPKPNNPLDRLPPSAKEDAKSLFLALYFHYPHDFLPALDLLDRGLITHLIPSHFTDIDTTTGTTPLPRRRIEENDVFYIQSASAVTDHRPSRPHTTPDINTSSVRSEPPGRFHNAFTGKGSATQTFYEVILDSWNCSCSAFAFSSFQGISLLNDDAALVDAVDAGAEQYGRRGEHAGFGNEDDVGSQVEGETPGGEEGIGSREDEGENVKAGIGRVWSFGGTATREGLGAGVPVCKHILAAVMVKAAPRLFAEGLYVHVKRDVGREEMAGWGAGWGDGG